MNETIYTNTKTDIMIERSRKIDAGEGENLLRTKKGGGSEDGELGWLIITGTNLTGSCC